MPFKSEKQRRWMWANEPEMAKKWSKEEKKMKKTPRMSEVFRIKESLPQELSGAQQTTPAELKTDLQSSTDNVMNNLQNITKNGNSKIYKTKPEAGKPSQIVVSDEQGSIQDVDPVTGNIQPRPQAGPQKSPMSPRTTPPGTSM